PRSSRDVRGRDLPITVCGPWCRLPDPYQLALPGDRQGRDGERSRRQKRIATCGQGGSGCRDVVDENDPSTAHGGAGCAALDQLEGACAICRSAPAPELELGDRRPGTDERRVVGPC